MDLEKLIQDWYRRPLPEGSTRTPTAECPPLTRLWQHVTGEHPLEEYEEHVSRCERCRRVCEIIEWERERERQPLAEPVAVARPGGRRLIYAGGGLLAAAASVALLITAWPTPSFDTDIAAFAAVAYDVFGSPVRGEGEQSPTGSDDQPEWLSAALTDPAARKALGDQTPKDLIIRLELLRGHLRIDDEFRPAVAEGIEVPETQRKDLIKLIEEDRTACEVIVDALIRHHPGATGKDRDRLTESFHRWRAEYVFGPQRPGE